MGYCQAKTHPPVVRGADAAVCTATEILAAREAGGHFAPRSKDPVLKKGSSQECCSRFWHKMPCRLRQEGRSSVHGGMLGVRKWPPDWSGIWPIPPEYEEQQGVTRHPASPCTGWAELVGPGGPGYCWRVWLFAISRKGGVGFLLGGGLRERCRVEGLERSKLTSVV